MQRIQTYQEMQGNMIIGPLRFIIHCCILRIIQMTPHNRCLDFHLCPKTGNYSSTQASKDIPKFHTSRKNSQEACQFPRIPNLFDILPFLLLRKQQIHSFL